jgi:hypothetical protein
MAEAQKNVPIDESYHDQLKRIAIIDKTSMKNTVQKWIRKDGRGVETPAKKQEKIEPPKESQTAPSAPPSTTDAGVTAE